MSTLALPYAAPFSMSANRAETIALRQLTCLLLLALLLPCLPGTAWQFKYAYFLVAYLGWMFVRSRLNAPGRLPALAIDAAACGLIVSAAYPLSIVASSVPAIGEDYFQLAREPLPYFAFVCAASCWANVRSEVADRFLGRVAVAYLAATVLAIVLHTHWDTARDFFFRYYHIHGDRDRLYRYMVERPGFTFGNPNGFAFTTSLFTLLGITRRGTTPLGALALAVVGGVCVYWVNSRSGMATLGVGLLAVVFLHRPRLVLVGLLGLLAAALAVWLFQIDSVQQTLDDAYQRYFVYRGSLHARQDIWEKALGSDEFLTNWLLGVGPDKNGELSVFDSFYVTTLYRYGAVGLALTLLWPVALLYYGIRQLGHRRRRADGGLVVAMVVAMLVNGYAASAYSDPRICTILELLLASACATAVTFTRKDAQENENRPAFQRGHRSHGPLGQRPGATRARGTRLLGGAPQA